MGDADATAVAAFVPLASRYIAIVQNQELIGLPLLKELRQAIADLYAMAPRLPDHAPFHDPMRKFETLPEDGWHQIFNDLVRRLSRELYWSALLPLAYETVKDQGVRQLSEDLADIYRWFEDGFRLRRGGGTSQELLQWWGDWETSREV